MSWLPGVGIYVDIDLFAGVGILISIIRLSAIGIRVSIDLVSCVGICVGVGGITAVSLSQPVAGNGEISQSISWIDYQLPVNDHAPSGRTPPVPQASATTAAITTATTALLGRLRIICLEAAYPVLAVVTAHALEAALALGIAARR